jgi:hypothetical protein
MFKIIPTSWYVMAIAALVAAFGFQQVRVSNLKSEVSQEITERAVETAQRSHMALEHQKTITRLQSEHAASLQTKDDEYAKKILSLQLTSAADRADADRVRGKLASFTSGARLDGETDAAAGQRARDRLPLVGALLAEGLSLEAESRQIIQRRDAEVVLLLGVIKADRQACSPG